MFLGKDLEYKLNVICISTEFHHIWLIESLRIESSIRIAICYFKTCCERDLFIDKKKAKNVKGDSIDDEIK